MVKKVAHFMVARKQRQTEKGVRDKNILCQALSDLLPPMRPCFLKFPPFPIMLSNYEPTHRLTHP
jgi:hypothetical protein